jgi:hypothetical protein
MSEPARALQVPAAVWMRDDVLRALADKNFQVLFAIVQKYTGASQTKIGAATGLSQGDVSDIIRGERQVMTSHVIERVARGFDMPGTARAALGLKPILEAPDLPQPLTRRQSLSAREHEPADFVESRRSLLTMAAKRAQRFILLAEEETSPELVRLLHEDLQRIAVAYPQIPLGELLDDLVDTQDTLFTLLERRQTPERGRQLYFLASVASGLLAKASHDLAEPRAAMEQARTAFLCADRVPHDGLRAWLRGLQSLVAYWQARYTDALRYAEQGLEYARLAGGTAGVWLPLSAARSLAALGDRDQAVAMIRQAEAAWSHVRPDDVDQLGGICTFTEARATYYAADALAWLPKDEAATAYAADAVRAYDDPTQPSWSFGDQAGAHTDLALVRIGQRDLHGAAEALRPVLDLGPQQRIHGVIHSVQRVHQSIAHSGLAPNARSLIEEIEDFTRQPLTAIGR